MIVTGYRYLTWDITGPIIIWIVLYDFDWIQILNLGYISG